MALEDLSSITIAFKPQSVLGTPVTGAGAKQLEVLPSQGMQLQVAQIESGIIKRNRMKKRPRQGSQFLQLGYETELSVDAALFEIFGAVLGVASAPAAIALDETDLTTVVISGTGTLATFGGGDLHALGLVEGMMGRFTNLSVAGNNSKWFPILTVTTSTFAIPTGFLADNTSDNAFDLEIAAAAHTPATYTKSLHTIEENWGTIDRSKRASDCRWNKIVFDAQPDQHAKVSVGAGGRVLELLASGSSPNFTSPALSGQPSLVLLDGGVYVNGVLRANLTGLTFGIEAPVTGLPVISSKLSPDAFLGQFAFAGQVTGAVEDGTDFDAFLAEDQMSVLAHFRDGTNLAAPGIAVYMGNLAFGGYNTPAGGEGALIQTLPLFGGDDDRGAGYAPSTMVISYMP